MPTYAAMAVGAGVDTSGEESYGVGKGKGSGATEREDPQRSSGEEWSWSFEAEQGAAAEHFEIGSEGADSWYGGGSQHGERENWSWDSSGSGWYGGSADGGSGNGGQIGSGLRSRIHGPTGIGGRMPPGRSGATGEMHHDTVSKGEIVMGMMEKSELGGHVVRAVEIVMVTMVDTGYVDNLVALERPEPAVIPLGLRCL